MFFSDVLLNINWFFLEIQFEYKVYEFFDWHLFYSSQYVQNMHHYIMEKQKAKKRFYMNE